LKTCMHVGINEFDILVEFRVDTSRNEAAGSKCLKDLSCLKDPLFHCRRFAINLRRTEEATPTLPSPQLSRSACPPHLLLEFIYMAAINEDPLSIRRFK
jgi:hypothetical protein